MKIFLADGAQLDSAALLTLFHRIIRDELVPELEAIDVVSYRHVHEGPWVQLICTDGQYVLDGRGGRPGLKYISRSPEVSLAAALEKVRAVAAIVERELGVRFRAEEAELELFDRRKYPNTREGYLRATATIAPAIAEVFAHADLAWAGAADLLGVMRLGLHSEVASCKRTGS